jgi:hypothetical protein
MFLLWLMIEMKMSEEENEVEIVWSEEGRELGSS